MIFLPAVLISAGIGLIAAVIGLGGGFLYVPTLSLIFGLDPRMAVGTSLAAMMSSSVAASVTYRGQKKILYRAAIVLLIPSVVFSVLGSLATNQIDTRMIIALFAVVLILISLEMLLPDLRLIRKLSFGPSFPVRCRITAGREKQITIPYIHLFAWGALGGLVSGITGVSGGAFFVPALVAAGVPVHFAVATSLCTIIPTSIAGAFTHAALGHVSPELFVPYAIGAGIGAFTGARIAPRIHEDRIRQIFGVLILAIALLMIQEKVLI
ncbi:MAG TPA: sulfite exporter TauE/SafE family protein [Methanoregula sp.]|nr:sulfite exporter TauE/SafE family protein [Methanoregula sp.]